MLQPYRTTPLVLPHAKTIHDKGKTQNKFISATKEPQTGQVYIKVDFCNITYLVLQPYRNSTLVTPAPRTINEAGAGAGPYQPYRGPQYYADRKPIDKVRTSQELLWWGGFKSRLLFHIWNLKWTNKNFFAGYASVQLSSTSLQRGHYG